MVEVLANIPVIFLVLQDYVVEVIEKMKNVKLTFVTAAIKVSSDIGRSVVFENDTDSVMTAGEEGSRVACSEILKLV